MSDAITVFPKTLARLGKMVKVMVLDEAALQRPLAPCDLAECGGTCCHDGAYLSSEEAEVIRGLVEESQAELMALGMEIPELVVVYGKSGTIASGPKTAVRNAPMRDEIRDYPKHFPETRCVFLLSGARCALQELAMARGRHPWDYKPTTCWLHPLAITGVEETRTALTLYDESTDPQREGDYAGFASSTHCGRTCGGGKPAWEVLREEIRRLGDLGGRDLLSNLARPAHESIPPDLEPLTGRDESQDP